jgi:hypothetical protein
VQKVLLTWREENTEEYSKLDLNPIIKPTDFNIVAKK